MQQPVQEVYNHKSTRDLISHPQHLSSPWEQLHIKAKQAQYLAWKLRVSKIVALLVKISLNLWERKRHHQGNIYHNSHITVLRIETLTLAKKHLIFCSKFFPKLISKGICFKNNCNRMTSDQYSQQPLNLIHLVPAGFGELSLLINGWYAVPSSFWGCRANVRQCTVGNFAVFLSNLEHFRRPFFEHFWPILKHFRPF